MSTLYIANTNLTGSVGVWRPSSSIYKYVYTTFTPGQDVNLDLVSVRTNVNIGAQQTPIDYFQVGIYAAGANSSVPGSLITYLSGPASPTAGTYNDYAASSATSLASGNQYWLGFTLSSDVGADSDTRVKIGVNSGNFTTLGAGWTAPNTYYEIVDGTASPSQSGALVYSLYATPASQAVCFIKGTRILMADRSEKAIEDLRIGDVALTSNGCLPIKWVAKQTIRRHLMPREKYADSLPICIEAGSLGKGIPKIDLLVSGPHGIHVDGRVVAASCLVNDLNIHKAKLATYPEAISYFHLEFEEEVFVVANGAQACSYANENNRRNFDNYPEFVSLYVNADLSVKSYISKSPRNQPSLQGHKARVKRSWQAA